MSLRGFHIFFITVSIALSFGFAAWCFNFYGNFQNFGYFITGFFSAMTGMGLILYLNSFVRKASLQ